MNLFVVYNVTSFMSFNCVYQNTASGRANADAQTQTK